MYYLRFAEWQNFDQPRKTDYLLKSMWMCVGGGCGWAEVCFEASITKKLNRAYIFNQKKKERHWNISGLCCPKVRQCCSYGDVVY